MAFEGAANISIINSAFIDNNAKTDGGGILGSQAASLQITNTTFAYNKAGADESGASLTKTSALGGAISFGNLSVNAELVHNTFVGNESLATSNGGGAIAISSAAAAGTTLTGNFISGNFASNGSNLFVAAAGSNSASVKFVDAGYNLVGHNNDAGIAPLNAIDFSASSSFVGTALTVQDQVELTPRTNGGDGYFSRIRMLPILGGGEARDIIPEADCAVELDARGEERPDIKVSMCDIGAYEFTVLSCQEDAARRFAQGETFVKSCADGFENYQLDLGYIQWLFLSLMSALLLVRKHNN
jgi:predicted outer membrane repeat protein